MVYYGGLTALEAYNLPVPVKRWWTERIVKELNKNAPNNAEGGQSRALHNNSPEVRAMQGRTRTQVPSRLRRFT
jgi:hypothetical protein